MCLSTFLIGDRPVFPSLPSRYCLSDDSSIPSNATCAFIVTQQLQPRPHLRPKRSPALDQPTPSNVVFIPALTFHLPLTILNTGTIRASSFLPSSTRCFHSCVARYSKIPAVLYQMQCHRALSATNSFASLSGGQLIRPTILCVFTSSLIHTLSGCLSKVSQIRVPTSDIREIYSLGLALSIPNHTSFRDP
jgi:hypothetical protein